MKELIINEYEYILWILIFLLQDFNAKSGCKTIKYDFLQPKIMLCLTTLGYIIMCIHVDGDFDWQFNSWFKQLGKLKKISISCHYNNKK